MHHAAIVRSPHAHAKIRAIDITRAVAAPGVLLVHGGAWFQGDREQLRGYGILQPRVSASLPGANRSWYARLLGGDPSAKREMISEEELRQMAAERAHRTQLAIPTTVTGLDVRVPAVRVVA